MSQPICDWPADESMHESRPVRRRSRKTRFVIVLAVVCLLFASIAAWKFATLSRSRLGGTAVGERMMTDGTVLVLEHVASSKPYEMTIQRPGGSMVASWMSGRSSATQQRIGVYPNDSAVVLWLTRWRPGQPDSLDFDWWLTSVVTDAHGEEIPDGHEQSHVVAAAGGLSSRGAERPWAPLPRARNDVVIATSQFPALRQSAGLCKVRVYDRSGAQVAELLVPFPDTSSAPRWSADPLPTTKLDDDVQVMFAGVKISERTLPANSPVKLVHRRPHWSVVPEFEVQRNGAPAPEWKSESVRFTDELGNVTWGGDCSLSVHEPAWKLELTLARDAPQAFAADEQWESALVPLPAAKSSQPVDARATVQQVEVSLVAVGSSAVGYDGFARSTGTTTQRMSGPRQIGGKPFGVSHSSLSSGGPTKHSAIITGDCVHFLVKLDRLPPMHRHLFRVSDDQGRELPHGVESFTMGDTEYAFVFFDPAADATGVRITAFVHTARKVELLIAPPKNQY